MNRNKNGGNMKKEKIEPRPEVQEYAKYFRERAKRVLGLKESEFYECHVDLINLESVEVWFFSETKDPSSAKFTTDGRLKKKPGDQK